MDFGNALPVAQYPSSFCDIVASAVARTSPEMIVHSARWVSINFLNFIMIFNFYEVSLFDLNFDSNIVPLFSAIEHFLVFIIVKEIF